MPKMVCTVGLRRSLSISRVFHSICANERARVAATVVLPSPGRALVTRMTLCRWSSLAATLVRRLRNSSPKLRQRSVGILPLFTLRARAAPGADGAGTAVGDGSAMG